MKKVFLLCLVLVLAMVSAAQATLLPEGSVPLARLFGGGGSIIANDKIFDRFTFFDGFKYGNLANVWVSPLTDDPRNPGLRYMTNEWTVYDEDSMNLEFGFRVSTLNGQALIHDNSLEIIQYSIEAEAVEGSVIRIVETVYDPRFNEIGFKEVFANQLLETSSLFDHVEFPLQTSLWVRTNISMISDFEQDLVELYVFDQRFSQVPEPATMFLLGTSLVGVAGAARRKKKNQA